MQIQTYVAQTDNDGAFRDAGSTLDVGDKSDQISADVAQSLLDRGLAVEVPQPVPAPARTAKAQDE